MGAMGGTYGGGPLACATANATIDVIREEDLLGNATQRGNQLVAVRGATHAPTPAAAMNCLGLASVMEWEDPVSRAAQDGECTAEMCPLPLNRARYAPCITGPAGLAKRCAHRP